MTQIPFRLLTTFLALSFVGEVALAQSTGVAANPVSNTAPPTKGDPRATIVKKIDGLKLEDVRMTPVNGVFEITRGSDISYSSSDGRYVIIGDMIDLDSDANITENRRRGIRAQLGPHRFRLVQRVHPARRAAPARGDQRMGARARTDVEHLVSGPDDVGRERIADAGERFQRDGRNGIELSGRIAEELSGPPAGGEVELALGPPRNIGLHPAHRAEDHLAVK